VAADTITAGTPRTPGAGSLAAELQSLVDQHHVPGASAGILVDGDTHTASVGVTNVEHPLPVTDTTLFQVGSITKTFVSAGILVLAEEGKLALEDPIGKHLPDLADRTGLDTDGITVEHLLSHRSGFDGDHLLVSQDARIDALRDARRLFEPGAGVSYNNAAFSLAGEVIAAVSGVPFDEFTTQRLLKPLGIRGYFTADTAITHRVASPHFVLGEEQRVIRKGGWQPGWELARVDWPAGGLISSVEGLLRWARFQLGDGDGVLSRESLERMQSPVVELDRWIGIGLDWFRIGRVLDHGGSTSGYLSLLVLVPDAGIAVASLTNATNGGIVNETIRRWALQTVAGIVERDSEPDPALAIDVARCEGRFLAPFAQLTIEPGDAPSTFRVVSAERDDVSGWKPPVPPPVTFAFVDDTHAVSIDAPGPQMRIRLGFERDRLEWLTWSARRAVRNS
jgi:CubicO group peptidase (beta-lactamase class C family)